MRPLLGWNLIIFSLLLQPSPPGRTLPGSPPVSFRGTKPNAQKHRPRPGFGSSPTGSEQSSVKQWAMIHTAGRPQRIQLYYSAAGTPCFVRPAPLEEN